MLPSCTGNDPTALHSIIDGDHSESERTYKCQLQAYDLPTVLHSWYCSSVSVSSINTEGALKREAEGGLGYNILYYNINIVYIYS